MWYLSDNLEGPLLARTRRNAAALNTARLTTTRDHTRLRFCLIVSIFGR